MTGGEEVRAAGAGWSQPLRRRWRRMKGEDEEGDNESREREKKERKRKEKREKEADMWTPLPCVIHISKTTLQNSQMTKYKRF